MWINQVLGRFGKQGQAREPSVHSMQAAVCAPCIREAPSQYQLDIEGWLDQKAEELNGEWTFARLTGFSRGEHAAARQAVAASLCPTDELWVESSPEDLYSLTALRLRTVQGAVVGCLEPAAAEAAARQIEDGGMIRCFVYSVTLTENQVPGVLLALMSWAFTAPVP